MVKPYSEEIKQNWKNLILEQRKSNLSIASWCRQRAVAAHTFHYWQNKLFPNPAPARSDFTEIASGKVSSSTGIIIEYRDFNIRIDKNFEPSLLQNCLEALKRC